VVLKLGGELIEGAERLKAIGKVIKQASRIRPLIVVHGGGREIDASLAQVGIPKRQVDGLRVTDPETLEIVVSVLAGSINTRFVAAINAAGGRAIGLTGADAGVAPVKKAALHKATSGDTVDLGMVGTPVTTAVAPELLTLLCNAGYVPVIACVSSSKEGQLFNAKLVTSGTANAGMVAKLTACEAALAGASSVVIIDGRDPRRIARAVALLKTTATSRVVK